LARSPLEASLPIYLFAQPSPWERLATATTRFATIPNSDLLTIALPRFQKEPTRYSLKVSVT